MIYFSPLSLINEEFFRLVDQIIQFVFCQTGPCDVIMQIIKPSGNILG